MSELKLEGIINNVLEICNDCDTFSYHRGYGYSVRLKENLGSGRVLSAIGLFSAIGFLAKLHKILSYGNKIVDYSEEYGTLRKTLKELDISNKLIDRYLKPKNKLEINETEAFVKLINDYPNDFGLENLSNTELQVLWNEYRNHLIHTCFVGNESMIIESIFSHLTHPMLKHIPDSNDFQENRYKKRAQEHSFSFISNKEELRGKIIHNYTKEGFPVDLGFILRATTDEIKIDNFNVDIRNIATWILDNYNNGAYATANINDLDVWLTETGIKRSYKAKMPEDFDINKLKLD